MAKKYRVLQVCALNAGGIETFVMNIYRELKKENIVFDFVNYFDPKKEQFHEKEVSEYGSNIYKTGSFNYKNPLVKHLHKNLKLYTFIKKNNYDVVHVHASDNVSLEDCFIAKIAGVKKIIVHSHNTSINKEEQFYKLKVILNKCTKRIWRYVATDFFACSTLAAEWMFDEGLNKNNRVKIVNNAIDSSKYIFNDKIRKEYKSKLNIESNILIGHIGRFSYQKNHEFLIDIFNELKVINPSAKLLLIGSGELEDNIKEKVKSLDLEKDIIFYGLSNKCSELMQVMDVFVLPSRFEGLPLVGIEAQASGLKVLVSDKVSKQMKITDNVEYLPLELGSKKWAEKINNACNNYKRKDMSNKIKISGFDILEVAKELKKCYLLE